MRPKVRTVTELDDGFDEGFLVGLLVGEGHFGGDGRQPQVTLRMHVRHEALFRWIERTFPGGRLYGPYHHDGRSYYQWMARGAFLRERLLPILLRRLTEDLDDYALGRLAEMCERYRRQLRQRGEPDPSGDATMPEHGSVNRSTTPPTDSDEPVPLLKRAASWPEPQPGEGTGSGRA